MKKNTNIKQWLIGALVVQLVLIAIVFNLNDNTQKPENRNLVANFSSVNRIVIADENNQSSLLRKGDQWVLPDLHELPVNISKWQTQLDKLGLQQLRWPVSNSSKSHERFEVSDKKFNKRIDLFQDKEKVGSFYIGGSLGLKESYVRELDNDKTFTVDLNGIDFPANDNEWLDKQLLNLNNISGIETQNFKIEKQSDQWILASQTVDAEEKSNDTADSNESSTQIPSGEDNPAQRKVIQSKAQEVVAALESLAILNVVKSVNLENSTSLTITTNNDNVTYVLTEDEDKRYLKSSAKPAIFEISKANYEKLTNIPLDQIVEEVTEEIEEEAVDQVSEQTDANVDVEQSR